MKDLFTIAIIGGGAAGFFAALQCARNNPNAKVIILERGKEGLQKVKISGGGRCNVTHAEFIPANLVEHYPRGRKELLGPFHSFMTGDIMAWFEKRGVELKVEDDGRVFPVTDSSQTIIDTFLAEAKTLQIDVFYNHKVIDLKTLKDEFLIFTDKEEIVANRIIMATGSNTKMWKLLNTLGHSIVPPVPSLFTFDVNDNRIANIPGVVVKNVEVIVLGTDLASSGPLLITHVGLSAPSILKLSAFGALELAKRKYNFKIQINFVGKLKSEAIIELKELRHILSKKTVCKFPQFDVPRRLWLNLVLASGIDKDMRWAELTNEEIDHLSSQLTEAIFKVTGKSTFKEEFVTAGGVDLKEINFKTFESKLIPHLYFAGEVMNIDAVTGGFNFQNAWTSAYIAAKSATA